MAAQMGGCALIIPQTAELYDQWPAALPERAELSEVPFFAQREYHCGPASLATTLRYAGIDISPDELVARVYLPARHGSLQAEMLAAPRTYGIVSYQLSPRFEDMLREVAAGNPVIVLQDFGVWPISVWHYAVVVGYERAKGEVILRSGSRKRLTMPFAVLEYVWKESDYWAMVSLAPGQIPATATEVDYAKALAAVARVSDPRTVARGYAAFLSRWPDDPAAAIAQGNALYSLGELKEAESVLRRALEHHSDSVPILNNLAQVLSDLGRNDEALPLIEKALATSGPFSAFAQETHELILRRISSSGGSSPR
ncbi:MAG TPA: PA2778 family cysteine peptidase [Usitatibacter sp.]|nr:PA2778 family cysteine peptidase [Usitatibacter sp.]